jgi:hypothetical protein
MHRFGEREIDENVIKSVPKNTEKSKNSVWRQFMSFCAEKNYTFNPEKYWFQVFCIFIREIFSLNTTCA